MGGRVCNDKSVSMMMISTNRKPIVCYEKMEDIEMVDIPVTHYFQFGDFEDVILGSIYGRNEGEEEEEDKVVIERYIGRDLWSMIDL